MQISAKNQIEVKLHLLFTAQVTLKWLLNKLMQMEMKLGVLYMQQFQLIYVKMELAPGNFVTCIFPAATVILAKHDEYDE